MAYLVSIKPTEGAGTVAICHIRPATALITTFRSPHQTAISERNAAQRQRAVKNLRPKS